MKNYIAIILLFICSISYGQVKVNQFYPCRSDAGDLVSNCFSVSLSNGKYIEAVQDTSYCNGTTLLVEWVAANSRFGIAAGDLVYTETLEGACSVAQDIDSDTLIVDYETQTLTHVNINGNIQTVDLCRVVDSCSTQYGFEVLQASGGLDSVIVKDEDGVVIADWVDTNTFNEVETGTSANGLDSLIITDPNGTVYTFVDTDTWANIQSLQTAEGLDSVVVTLPSGQVYTFIDTDTYNDIQVLTGANGLDSIVVTDSDGNVNSFIDTDTWNGVQTLIGANGLDSVVITDPNGNVYSFVDTAPDIVPDTLQVDYDSQEITHTDVGGNVVTVDVCRLVDSCTNEISIEYYLDANGLDSIVVKDEDGNFLGDFQDTNTTYGLSSANDTLIILTGSDGKRDTVNIKAALTGGYTFETDTTDGWAYDSTFFCGELIHASRVNLCDLAKEGLISYDHPELANQDCDCGGVTNGEEIANGTNPNSPKDDCIAAIAAGIDICALCATDALNPLCLQDCDDNGLANLTECQLGQNPIADFDYNIQLIKEPIDSISNMQNAGDTVFYQMTVINPGSIDLSNVCVQDPDAIVLGNCIATLAGNATDNTTITAYHVVTPIDVFNNFIINQATVTGTATDPNTGNTFEVSDYSDDNVADSNQNDIEGDGEPDDPTFYCDELTVTLSFDNQFILDNGWNPPVGLADAVGGFEDFINNGAACNAGRPDDDPGWQIIAFDTPSSTNNPVSSPVPFNDTGGACMFIYDIRDAYGVLLAQEGYAISQTIDSGVAGTNTWTHTNPAGSWTFNDDDQADPNASFAFILVEVELCEGDLEIPTKLYLENTNDNSTVTINFQYHPEMDY